MAKRFKGFTPEQTIALIKKMGYGGYVDSSNIQNFLSQNPDAANRINQYAESAQKMLSKNTVPTMKMAPGGAVSSFNDLTNDDLTNGPAILPIDQTPITLPIEPPPREEPKPVPVGIPVAPPPAPTVEDPTKIVKDIGITRPDIANAATNVLRSGEKPTSYTLQKNATGGFDMVFDTGVVVKTGFTKQADADWNANAIIRAANTYGTQTEAAKTSADLFKKYQEDVQAYQKQTRGQATTTTADLSGSIANLRSDINTSKVERDNYARELSALPENDPRRATLSTLIGNLDKDIATKQQSLSTLTAQQPTLADITAKQVTDPTLPTGATITPVTTATTPSQFISAGAGQVTGQMAVPTTLAGTTTVEQPDKVAAETVEAVKASPDVEKVVAATKAVTGEVSPEAQATAQTMDASKLAQLGMTAAQIDQAQTVKAPPPLEVQAGELISGPSVDMARVEELVSNVKAAEATPSEMATVQGQMAQLMTQFEGKEPPAWAAGAMRAATATLAARGLGASSLAGQAIVQAAMESALPIAMQDAQTRASFEAQNLSNRQQVAMFAAEQRAAFMGMEFTQDFQARVQNAARIADVANMNFNADVQIALENSRNAQTVDIANLNARNAKLLADMAAMTQVELTNLNNRQQVAVQNANAFLQMDMQNLSNEQQTVLFKSQARIQAMLTDTAAENAARQFNASSKMQTEQFNVNLASQISQFNASQKNAQDQFNAAQKNTVERFNAELNNQREQFNAANQLIIEQSNVQWRRELATAETEAVNRANELNANNLLNISKTAQDNLWQYHRDNMEWAWTSAENEKERASNLAIAVLNADTEKAIAEMKQDAQSSASFGALVAKVFTSNVIGNVLS